MRKLVKRLKDQKGMTLVELLAVIVILGIVALIAIPSIGNIIQNSKIDAVKADGIQIINAAKMYHSSNNVPSDGDDVPLSSLMQFVDLETTWVDTSVDISFQGGNGADKGKAIYKLSGTGKATDGETEVTFTNATITNINNAEKGLKDITATTGVSPGPSDTK